MGTQSGVEDDNRRIHFPTPLNSLNGSGIFEGFCTKEVNGLMKSVYQKTGFTIKGIKRKVKPIHRILPFHNFDGFLFRSFYKISVGYYDTIFF